MTASTRNRCTSAIGDLQRSVAHGLLDAVPQPQAGGHERGPRAAELRAGTRIAEPLDARVLRAVLLHQHPVPAVAPHRFHTTDEELVALAHGSVDSWVSWRARFSATSFSHTSIARLVSTSNSKRRTMSSETSSTST